MYFKRLELHGFKSFAEPLVIEFHEGVTCIVGPNGSGKSNISDAIRWVLGEQSPKALRGGKMEEVIFNGTENRRPRGMAEVTLVIDNSEHILDIDYSEVAITRRMYRSGESEYMINENPCRLKDIRELIMDTGIGVEGYSIIGQGKIADIVSNKPEGRRQIFEEAAGIVAYKTRKAEAERKLVGTRNNLDRIQDIVSEIEDRIDGLKEDSEKAKRFLELRDRYRELEINITLRNIENANSRTEQYRGDIQEFDKKIEEIVNSKKEQDRESQELQARSTALDKLYTEAHDKQLRNIEEINVLKSGSEINRERLTAIDRDEERLRGELSDLDTQIEKSRGEVGRLTKEKNELTEESKKAERELEEKIMAYNEIASGNAEAAGLIDTNNDLIFRLNSDAVSKRSEAKSYESIKDTLTDRRSQLVNLNKDLAGALSESEKKLSDMKKDLETGENRQKEIEKSIVAGDREKRETEDKRNALRVDRETLRIELNRMEARKKAIEDMEQAYDGYQHGVRYVLKKKMPGIDGVVAELMDVPEGLELAMETALGASMQNIVCKDDKSARDAIEELKRNREGRVTFLPISSIRYRNADERDLEKIENEKGFKGLASELVSFDSKHEKVFEYLLGRVAVTEDLESAIALSKKIEGRLRFVTVDGEFVNNHGAITGGKSKKKGSSLLERKTEIQKLNKDIKQGETDLEEKEKTLMALEKTLSDILEKQQDEEKKQGELKLELVALAQQVSQMQASCGESKESIERNEEEVKEIDRQLADADDLVAKMLKESEEADKEVARLSQEIEEAMKVSSSRKEDEEKAQGEITEGRIASQKWQGKINNLEEILTRETGLLEGLENRREARNSQLAAIIDERDRLVSGAEGSDERVRSLEEAKTEIEEQILGINKEKEEVSGKLEALTSELSGREEDLNRFRDDKYQLEIKVTKNETQVEAMKQRLWDEFEMSYAQAMDVRKEDFPVTASVKESREIRNELREMGDVNVGAIPEYESVSQRYQFLTEQREDVLKAMDELETIISDMDRTITRTFKENFDKVAENFEGAFTDLFGGGHAELRMENEKDPLESGIDIIAQPPGKKLQNINLLSGGEKTMTAIALMFAVLKTTPTPFCILDEVEAALDDENIDRFSNYLKKFMDTQFALITHQRATMEHADVLYGITMPERGISKVLSLRLGDYDPDEYTS